MSGDVFINCPRCGALLEPGFAHKNHGLSFVAPAKLEQFLSVDKDLAEAGLRKMLPSPASYFRSYVCRGCELYFIDYSRSFGREEARQLAESMAGRRQTGASKS